MPESGVTKHNYLFCQFVNPVRGHKGDRCDCFDSPSQRRTRLAKQRLARLRADRSINRASTSGNQESAVASDLAVTVYLCSVYLPHLHAHHLILKICQCFVIESCEYLLYAFSEPAEEF